LGLILLRDAQVDVEMAKLLWLNRSRAFHHKIRRFGCLWECNYTPKRRSTAQNSYQMVKRNCQSANRAISKSYTDVQKIAMKRLFETHGMVLTGPPLTPNE
jgi:hypothetical protein